MIDLFSIPLLLFVGLLAAATGAYVHEVQRLARTGSRFEARVVADSLNALTGSRLTTMVLTYPRYVHAEFLTHRLFARNASSSRAIPSAKMRRLIRDQMAIPPQWGENKPGMQAGRDVSRRVYWFGVTLWIMLGHTALIVSALLDRLGVHKQIVNRVVEPWAHITVVVTGEDQAWANFYALRVHPMADPTIERLAAAALAEHRTSRPRLLEAGAWHLPFVSDAERSEEISINTLVAASVARAARTSYLNHDGTTPDLKKDLALYVRLVGSTPKHASPTEHQARVDEITGRGGCFGATGWVQHRKEIDGECVRDLSTFIPDPERT